MELYITRPYKSKLVGSASKKNSLFPSDRDYFTKIPIKDENDLKTVSKNLQLMVKRIIEAPDLFFKELKGGIYKGKKVRWTAKQVLNGRINKNFTLNDIWNNTHNDIVKVDFIKFIENRFVENTIVFELVHKNGVPLVKHEDFKEVIKSDIGKYLKQKNYWKALKRLSLLKPKKTKLLMLFNSPLGYLSQLINEIEQFNYVKTHYKEQISPEMINEAKLEIRRGFSVLELDEKLSKTKLNNILQKRTLKWIRENNISFDV